jgi:integrase
MSRPRRGNPARSRVGHVSIYHHHNAWWIYYREHGKPVRHRIGRSRDHAQQMAAQINAQLASAAPTMLAFSPTTVRELRQKFLEYHEHVLRSSIATIRRYRSATHHFEQYVVSKTPQKQAHAVDACGFVAYLRQLKVAPNGHPNTSHRHLRDKGIQFILETCRAMYSFAAKRRHLPPYADNPFAALPLQRLKIENAKPIFVFDASTELAFFQIADVWEFPIHFALAKSGIRVGELVHLLIGDVDLASGWLHIRNKPGLGWRIKTGNERTVPLLPELVLVLRRVIGSRSTGPVFLRRRFNDQDQPEVAGDYSELECLCDQRADAAGSELTRSERARIAHGLWRDIGAIKADAIRTSFVRIMQRLGHSDATCPKSWRHSFATLLQDANVDPLIRQRTLGHQPTLSNGLGMTAKYTHTRPQTQRQQIEQALRLRPDVLTLARAFAQGGQQSDPQPTP